MKCPVCNTENRDDKVQCYQCSADISLLKTIVSKAHEHYNRGLEHAERGRTEEAIIELSIAISIYNDFPQAHNVLGTLYAKSGNMEKAMSHWQATLNLDPPVKKAAEYFYKVKNQIDEPFYQKRFRFTLQMLVSVTLVLIIIIFFHFMVRMQDHKLKLAGYLINTHKYKQAGLILNNVATNPWSFSHQISAYPLRRTLQNAISDRYLTCNSYFMICQYEKGLQETIRTRTIGLPVEADHKFGILQRELTDALIDQKTKVSLDYFSKTRDYEGATKYLKNVSLYPLNKDEQLTLTNKISQLDNFYATFLIETVRISLKNNQTNTLPFIFQKLNSLKLNQDLKIILNDLKTDYVFLDTQNKFSLLKEYAAQNDWNNIERLKTTIDKSLLNPQQRDWLNSLNRELKPQSHPNNKSVIKPKRKH